VTVVDWANVVSFQPSLYFRPKTWEKLTQFLHHFVTNNLTTQLRVMGSLHSCSNICESDAILDLSDIPKTIQFSENNTIAIASANFKLRDFLTQLHIVGKSIHCCGGTDEQTLAGLISTNTAPATKSSTVYENLLSVDYITVEENRVVEKTVQCGDTAFNAVVCSLGALGILKSVKFRLEEELFFRVSRFCLIRKEFNCV
jgi:FAD/FMN-containing dehydrogenase